MLPRPDDPRRGWRSHRGISLIACATKPSEFPKQTCRSVIFLIGADVLTDYLHLKGGSGGMLLTPWGGRLRELKVPVIKWLLSCGVNRVYASLQTGPVVTQRG